MRGKAIFGVGVTGAAVVAICCFTPALVVLLAAFGLSASVLDAVLLPLLGAFVALIAYGARRMRAEALCCQRKDA